MYNEELERKMLKNNGRFRWKVIQDLEKINLGKNYPKYPVLFLTCMDPRIDIHKIFQLNPGDVFVLRNAGNFLTIDMLRSILIAIHEYNIKNLIILGHLDCEMTKINLTELREKLYSKSQELIIRNKNNPYSELQNFFNTFKDVLKNINEQVETLRDFKGFPIDVKIIGWLYDIHTGWVFETNNISNFESIEDFKKAYRDLIAKKDLELVDSLISLEEEATESKISIQEKDKLKVNIESLNERKASFISTTEYINHSKQFNTRNINKNISIREPRLTIPKIYVPKIKVNVPNVYKREKQESKI